MRAPLLEPDHDQIKKFVDAIFCNVKMDGFVSLRAFYQDNKVFKITSLEIGRSCDPTSAKRKLDRGMANVLINVATREAARAAQESKPVNFCPPLAVFNNRKKAREEDITQGPVISVEADSRPKAARDRLEAILGPATVVIESGGFWTNAATGEAEPKLHLHWRLKKPATDKDALTKLKQARDLACTIVGGDRTNIPVNHPIRWPGSWHRKAEPRLAKIIALNAEHEIELDWALKRLTKEAPEAKVEPHVSGDNPQTDPKLAAIAIENISNDFDDAESWDEWNRIGMALYRATGGDEAGRKIFHDFSKKSKQGRYNAANTDARWESYHRSPPTKIGAGTLFDLAYKNNKKWRDEYDRKVEARFTSRSEPMPKVDEEPTVDDSPPTTDNSQSTVDQEPKVAAAAKFDPLFDPWAKFVVPKFPLDVLPRVLKVFVDEQSENSGCDPSGLPMAVLTAASGALDHRFQIKMMKHGSWYVAPRFWTLMVGEPSDKKSLMMDEATRPLEKYQAELLRDYVNALKEYEHQEKKEDTWIDKPEPPPRYVTWNTTIEKLGEFFARSPKGLLVKQDEIAGWVGAMERYGSRGAGASDRAFWLKTHDGGPYSMDRISRGENYIENLSATILGGIQPRRFAELKNLTSDGLLQRFLVVILKPGEFTLDRPADDRDYESFIRGLIGLKPQTLNATEATLAALESLRKHIHELERAAAGLAYGFGSFIGKLPLAAGALAIILHLSDNPPNSAVEEQTIEKVRHIVIDFLIPHAGEFYQASEAATDGDRIQQLASYVVTSGKKRFLASDFASNVASMRGLSLKEINERVSPLIAAGWLDPDHYKCPIVHGWSVSDDVATQFAERKKQEEERKAEIARVG